MLKGNCSSAKFKRPQNRCRCVKGLLIDRCEHSNFKAIPKFNNGPKGHGLQIADCRRKDKHTSPGREVFLPLFSVPVIDKGKSGGNAGKIWRICIRSSRSRSRNSRFENAKQFQARLTMHTAMNSLKLSTQSAAKWHQKCTTTARENSKLLDA